MGSINPKEQMQMFIWKCSKFFENILIGRKRELQPDNDLIYEAITFRDFLPKRYIIKMGCPCHSHDLGPYNLGLLQKLKKGQRFTDIQLDYITE